MNVSKSDESKLPQHKRLAMGKPVNGGKAQPVKGTKKS